MAVNKLLGGSPLETNASAPAESASLFERRLSTEDDERGTWVNRLQRLNQVGKRLNSRLTIEHNQVGMFGRQLRLDILHVE